MEKRKIFWVIWLMALLALLAFAIGPALATNISIPEGGIKAWCAEGGGVAGTVKICNGSEVNQHVDLDLILKQHFPHSPDWTETGDTTHISIDVPAKDCVTVNYSMGANSSPGANSLRVENSLTPEKSESFGPCLPPVTPTPPTQTPTPPTETPTPPTKTPSPSPTPTTPPATPTSTPTTPSPPPTGLPPSPTPTPTPIPTPPAPVPAGGHAPSPVSWGQVVGGGIASLMTLLVIAAGVFKRKFLR